MGTNAVSAHELSGNGGGLTSNTANTHVSPMAGITTSNASTMHIAWHVNTQGFVSHAPLPYNGRAYFTDWGGNAYAVDEHTGNTIWSRKLEQPNMQWPWHGLASTGVIYNGMLIEASVEGMAWGLDLNNGNILWSTSYTAGDQYAGTLGTLFADHGLVYLPVDSVDEPLSTQKGFVPKSRGAVVALNAKTGELVWRTYTVPENANGGAVWSSFAESGNTLYFDTGNNYTAPTTGMIDSMVAVDALTGSVLWHTQVTSHDRWTPADPTGPDYDFGAGPQLFVAPVNGTSTLLVGAGQKSGTYWAFDASNGNPVWHTQVGYGGVGGGIRGEASIGSGAIYAWSNNSWSDTKALMPSQRPINVEALDPATGHRLWADNGAQPAMGSSAGVLAGDVYFVGSLDGTIQGYAASDGKVVYKTVVPSNASVSSPLTAANGMLFVGVGAPAKFNGTGDVNGTGVYAYAVNQ